MQPLFSQALICWGFFFFFLSLHSIDLARDGNIPLRFLALSEYLSYFRIVPLHMKISSLGPITAN